MVFAHFYKYFFGVLLVRVLRVFHEQDLVFMQLPRLMMPHAYLSDFLIQIYNNIKYRLKTEQLIGYI